MSLSREPDKIILYVFAGLAIIVLTSRLMGWIFNRLGQPAVVGEVLGGIILGQSVLGLLPGDPSSALFPADIRTHLFVISSLGLVIYMFVIGLEVNPRSVRFERRAATSISLLSIATPFIFGSLLGYFIYGQHDRAEKTVNGMAIQVDVEQWPFVLFCGLAICGSAFAILARILDERQLFRTRMGGVLLASAVVDDIVVWTLASVVIAISNSGDTRQVLETLGKMTGFVLGLFVVIRPLIERFMKSMRATNLSGDIFAFLLVGLIASSLFTTWIGISPILGAFFFGVALPRTGSKQIFLQVKERLESISVLVLLPVFFAVTGLGVDLSTLGIQGFLLILVFVTVATFSKVTGAALAARFNGFRGRRSVAIGLLMNTRGLSELVLLSVGRSVGVLSTNMFTVLVSTALLTTLFSGPLLQYVYPKSMISEDIEQFERLRLKESSSLRVLALVDGGKGHSPTRDLGFEIALSESGSELILSHIQRSSTTKSADTGFMDDILTFASALEELDDTSPDQRDERVSIVRQSRIAEDVDLELLSQISRLRPHLVVVPFDFDHQLIERISTQESVDIVVAPTRSIPEESLISVRIGNQADLDLAAEVAVRLCIGGARRLILEGNRRLHSLVGDFQDLGVLQIADASQELPNTRIGDLSLGNEIDITVRASRAARSIPRVAQLLERIRLTV